MAVNPITTDDLTIDMKSLLSIPVGDRVQAAASDNGFAQALMQALTPIQLAKAFPDYYRRELPDISNFILANRYLDKVGAGGFDQRGGGEYGYVPPEMYKDGKPLPAGQRPSGMPEATLEEMKEKLLEKGIDVDKTYDAIGNGIAADNPQVEFLKNTSPEKLAEMGIESYKDDSGKLMYRMAPQITDKEVSDRISGKVIAKESATENQKAVLDFASRWNINPQAAAGVLKIESGVSSDITGGAGNNYHGVFQLETGQIAGLTEKAGFGALTPEQYKKLSVADQLKVMDEYYKQWNVNPDFFTGDPETDASKMWALQLAPGNAKRIDYNNPNAIISGPGQAETITAGRGGPVTVGTAGAGSVPGGEKFLADSFERVQGNATPEQIAQYRKQQKEKQKTYFTREAYNQPSPTSSDAILERVEEEQAGFRKLPIKPELRNALEYAAEQSGIQMRVFSGGQTKEIHDAMEASGNKSSWRHSVDIEGIPGAADVFLEYKDKDGKMVTLSATNPEHAPLIAKFTENFSRVIPSAGVGTNYMVTGGQVDPTKFHYGGPNAPGGAPATWGNTPSYIAEAHAAGVAQRTADKESGIDPLKEWVIKKEQEAKLLEEKKTQANLEPVKETIPEVAKFQFGGTPTLQDDEDLTAVGPDGKPKFKFNSGEGLYVKPEANEYADDKIDELSNRIDKMAETQQAPKSREMPTSGPKADPKWAEKVASAYRSSGTQQRAFNRAQFRPEGRHVGDRGSPNIA
jgi:hypothetical protein